MKLVAGIVALLVCVQGAPTDPCEEAPLDACAAKVYFFAQNPVASTSVEDVNADCKKEEEAVQCATNYASAGCITGIFRGIYKQTFESVYAEHKGKCTEGHERRNDYFKYIPCLNKVGLKLGSCMRNLSSVLEATSAQIEDKDRVPYICCNLYEYQDCCIREISAECSKEHAAYGESILKAFAGDLPETLCSGYTLKDENCDLLPKLKLAPSKFITPVVPLLRAAKRFG